jgi:hypothetical protein
VPLDGLRDLEHERDRAKGVRQAAWTGVLAQHAREAVAQGELVIGGPRRRAVDRHRHDDEGRPG